VIYLAPLATNYRDDPDFNASDRAQEVALLDVRQRAIDEVLRGKMSPADLLELLESQEIDPVEYMDASTEALEAAINGGMEIEGWGFSTI
jgi:hypothetical protein